MMGQSPMTMILQLSVVVVLLGCIGNVSCQSNNDRLPKGIEECLQIISNVLHSSNDTDRTDVKNTEAQSTCIKEILWKFGGINTDFNISEHDIKYINALTNSLVLRHKRVRRQGAPTVPGTGMRIRQEYRRLTDAQRAAYHAAVNALKRSGEYDRFANIHQGSVVNTAHNGPSFLGWHRVYLSLYEEALRRIDGSVALPYWDTSLDFDMVGNPVNSIIWSAPFLGNGDGFVITGPFANWETRAGPLGRNIGRRSRLISKAAIARVLTRCNTSQITDPTGVGLFNLERIHNGGHVWVGGQMAGLNTAAHDPLFFMYHAFIDYIWERFRVRQAQVCGVNPETDYPLGVPLQGPQRPMDGFSQYRNIDGYRNYWTLNWYRYEESPTCSRTNNDCRTPFLRCDVGRGRCVSVSRSIPGSSSASFVAGFGGQSGTAMVDVERADAEESLINIGQMFQGPAPDERSREAQVTGRRKRDVMGNH